MCQAIWQDSVNEDISHPETVWTSTVASTGEKVNYIGEKWMDGYKDVKANTHKPTASKEQFQTQMKFRNYLGGF